MRWPLRYQILVPFAAVIAVLLVAVSLLNAYLAAQQSFRQTVHRLRDVAHTLADARFPLTDAVLRQAHGLSGAEFILTADGHNVLAASLPAAEALPQVAAVQSLGEAGTRSHDGHRRRALLSHRIVARAPGRRSEWSGAALIVSRAELARRPLAGRLSSPARRRWPGARGSLGRRDRRSLEPADRRAALTGGPHRLRRFPAPAPAAARRRAARSDPQRERPGRPARRNAAGRQTLGTPDAARPVERRAGASTCATTSPGADRRAASSAAVPTRRSRKPGRRAAAIDADRTTLAALSGRRPPPAPLPHRLRLCTR